MKIGVLTTFYSHKDSVVEKTKRLINVFESLNMAPYIQIGYSSFLEEFEELSIKLNELRDDHKIEYSIHQSLWALMPNFFLNLGSSDMKVKERTLTSLKKSVDFTRGIGAKYLSFHSGYAANKMVQFVEFETVYPLDKISYEEAYSNVEENLKELLNYAKNKVRLSIENLSYRPERRYLYSTPEDFRRLPDSINVLFDTGHGYFSSIRKFDSLFIKRMTEIIGGKITEIHISDNDGFEDQHKLVGFGNVSFPQIFGLIRKRQELPPLIIEANGYSEEDLKRAIRILLELVEWRI